MPTDQPSPGPLPTLADPGFRFWLPSADPALCAEEGAFRSGTLSASHKAISTFVLRATDDYDATVTMHCGAEAAVVEKGAGPTTEKTQAKVFRNLTSRSDLGHTPKK
ncbi:hypothetical protein E4U55_001095 [Claviceps digitariae]|nr:hypothetical protein E4U55_001095 [Claviceps digitariae]